MRECFQESLHIMHKLLQDHGQEHVGLSHHVKVAVMSGTQLIQLIDSVIPLYKIWLVEGVLSADPVMNMSGEEMLGGLFFVVIICGAKLLRVSLVDCVCWVILSF